MTKKVMERKEYLSTKDAAKVMGVNVRHLLNLKANHEIPFYIVNSRVIMFERHDIDRFMEKRRIEAVMY